MKTLLMVKERVINFWGKYEVYIQPVLKFLLTYICMSQINDKIGYMTRISGKPIALIVALAGSFLPVNLTLVILAAIVLAHMYALSLVVAIFVLALFLVLFLLYFRFASKDAVATLITAVGFKFHIPYVVPVSMGLLGTPSSMVSVGCGVIVHYVIDYISKNSADIAVEITDEEAIAKFKQIIEAFIGNRDMLLTVIAFAATVLVVYILRRLSINYAWSIAIVLGNLICFFIILIGNGALSANISAGGAFLGIVISIILNIILQFFCFNVNYNRTEKVQYEDDEYYYYVKAVPKNTVKLPGKASSSASSKKPVVSQSKPVSQTSATKTVSKTTAARPTASKNTAVKSAASKKPLNPFALPPRPANAKPLGNPFELITGKPSGQAKSRTDHENPRPESTSEKIIEPLSEEDLNQ